MNGSGSGSGSGSSKEILEAEAEAEAIKNSPLPHHWFRRKGLHIHRWRYVRSIGDDISKIWMVTL